MAETLGTLADKLSVAAIRDGVRGDSLMLARRRDLAREVDGYLADAVVSGAAPVSRHLKSYNGRMEAP